MGGDPEYQGGQWEECPASFFNVRDGHTYMEEEVEEEDGSMNKIIIKSGPTISEYKKTKKKIQSQNSIYEILTW